MLAERAARHERLDLGRTADDAVIDRFCPELYFFKFVAILTHRLVTGSGWRDFDQRQHRDQHYLQHRYK